MYTLYTIGYGALSLEELVERLVQYRITTVIDARKQPSQDGLSKQVLSDSLPAHTITYRDAGDFLGVDGQSDYRNISQTMTYVQGISRLLSLVAVEAPKGYIAIASDAISPIESHRHELIARTLIDPDWSVIQGKLGLAVRHILPDGGASSPLTPDDFSD